MRHRWSKADARALQRYMEQQAIREQVARSLGCDPDDHECQHRHGAGGRWVSAAPEIHAVTCRSCGHVTPGTYDPATASLNGRLHAEQCRGLALDDYGTPALDLGPTPVGPSS